jgi:hypothetical protein
MIEIRVAAGGRASSVVAISKGRLDDFAADSAVIEALSVDSIGKH